MIKPEFKELTGENQFSPKYVFTEGYFSIDVYGDFIATVTLQKSFDTENFFAMLRKVSYQA